MSSGVYVYGITAAGSLATPLRAGGIDPSGPPRVVDVGDLCAVVSDVDVAEFEGDALERNAATPEWLERKVRAHEYVLDEVVAATAVVPMRFGAIFSDPGRLTALLAEHADALKQSLARVGGRSEWGLKVHCDRRQLIGRLAGSTGVVSSGRGYLMQKKAQLDAEAGATVAAAEVAGEAHAVLGRLADEAVCLSPRPDSGVVLNGAYLVHDASRETFMQRVAELQRRNDDAFVFEVTGPWPPYNFTSADVTGPLVTPR